MTHVFSKSLSKFSRYLLWHFLGPTVKWIINKLFYRTAEVLYMQLSLISIWNISSMDQFLKIVLSRQHQQYRYNQMKTRQLSQWISTSKRQILVEIVLYDCGSKLVRQFYISYFRKFKLLTILHHFRRTTDIAYWIRL